MKQANTLGFISHDLRTLPFEFYKQLWGTNLCKGIHVPILTLSLQQGSLSHTLSLFQASPNHYSSFFRHLLQCTFDLSKLFPQPLHLPSHHIQLLSLLIQRLQSALYIVRTTLITVIRIALLAQSYSIYVDAHICLEYVFRE
jgi:ABC-type phosphate/phosphonate transport system permease subunit